MAEVQTTAKINIFATGQQHTEQPEFNNEGNVDQNAEQCHDIRPLPAKLTDDKPLNSQINHHSSLKMISLTNVESNKALNVSAGVLSSLKYRYIVLSYRGRTQSLVAKKKDISENRASRNFDLMITMTFEQRSSSLGHQCLNDCQASVINVQDSDHNSQTSAPQRQMVPTEITHQAPFLKFKNDVCSPTVQSSFFHQMTSEHNRSNRNSDTAMNKPTRTHRMVTRSQAGIVKPIDRLSLHTSPLSPIPKSPFLALKDPNWSNAMHDEYNALVKNGTWILVPRPSNVNLVRSMWLFKHKFHADGTLSRYKARLVANGSSQQLGVDFDETFSPVVKPATIRTVLSLAVSRRWPIHQLDVKNAFLNGDLSETVYMHQPPGFVDSRYPHHVCLLQRSLYGLKQAPRAWFQRFAGYATRAGFSPSRCDSSLFIYTQGSQVAYLLIYVDDIILTASSSVLLRQIIDSLHKEFDMTDLGALNYFLGISAVRHST
ncbi:ribonuclease H-like domain-containing protein [Tanacetum coccineum]|uniref:Ribonuclease H-like domain-containing protein n=1 Tax=Tanacetum coccineum TaxID=301880 RepID=A0ABQ4XYZ7_9ASTR